MIKRENAELLKRSISDECTGYIPRAELYKILAVDADLFFAKDYFIDQFIDRIKRIPDADVIKVVKCEECEHCKMDSHWQMQYCTKMSDSLHTHWLPKGFYCGYGERREENEG